MFSKKELELIMDYRLGICRSCMFPRLNTPSKKFIIKNDRKTTTSPTNAATIVPLASSTFVFSPPDRIHLIPPNIKKAKAIKRAITKNKVIIAPSKLPDGERVQRLKKSSPPELLATGHGLIGVCAAKAGRVRVKNENTEKKRTVNFFIN